jgi:hypothetical protein
MIVCHSCNLRHMSHLRSFWALKRMSVQDASRIKHHTSHVTRHTSHVTRHTSHVTRHQATPRTSTLIGSGSGTSHDLRAKYMCKVLHKSKHKCHTKYMCKVLHNANHITRAKRYKNQTTHAQRVTQPPHAHCRIILCRNYKLLRIRHPGPRPQRRVSGCESTLHVAE